MDHWWKHMIAFFLLYQAVLLTFMLFAKSARGPGMILLTCCSIVSLTLQILLGPSLDKLASWASYLFLWSHLPSFLWHLTLFLLEIPVSGTFHYLHLHVIVSKWIPNGETQVFKEPWLEMKSSLYSMEGICLEAHKPQMEKVRLEPRPPNFRFNVLCTSLHWVLHLFPDLPSCELRIYAITESIFNPPLFSLPQWPQPLYAYLDAQDSQI